MSLTRKFLTRWGGCPAVNSISHGIDTSTPKEKTQENEPTQNQLQNEQDEDDDETSSVQSNSLLSKYDETGIGSPTSGEEIREAQSLKEQTTNRRKKVEEGLKNRRDKKLSSKLSMDTQLLNISKEELSLKRKLVEQLEKPEVEFNSGVNKVLKSMENISSCIQQNSQHTSSPCQPTANTLSATMLAPFSVQPALITSQSRSVDTLPREMSKMKIRGTKKMREFMKRTTIVLISTSSDIYLFILFIYFLFI